MRRALAILVGLVLGLGIAILSAGRLSHLRTVAPSFLPVWTAILQDDSSIWHGRTTELRPAMMPVDVVVSWRFERLDISGVHWTLAVSGPGLAGEAAMTVSPNDGHAVLSAGRAEILFDDWPALIEGWPQGGLLTISGLRADLRSRSWTPVQISASVDWSRARLADVALGRGEAALTSDSGGAWRVPFSLTGAVLGVSGKVTGQTGTSLAQIELTVTPAQDMPDDLRRTLEQVAIVQPDGSWRISRSVDLGADWPLF